MLHEGTLAPNEWRMIGAGGHSQIFIMECDNKYLMVKFSGLSEFPMYRGVPAKYDFENVIISNPHATAINYQIYTAPKRMEFQEGRMIENGTQSITGTVSIFGQPLTDDGGTITPIGSSFAGIGFSDKQGSSCITILSSAENTNGVIVRSIVMNMRDAAPWAYMHIKSGPTGSETIMTLSQLGAINQVTDKFLKPGYVLAVCSAFSVCDLNLSYDIL